MVEKTRNALVKQKMGFNQMRNAVFWLERFMKQQNLSNSEIYDRLIKMGRNIGATFSTAYKPASNQAIDIIKELYATTVRSKVKVEKNGHKFIVTDSKCPLCKYEYKDIDHAGCTIQIGTISEMLENCGYEVLKSEILKSKTFGDNYCSHQFDLEKK
jgi:predicted hydrocarbon binding protein